MIREILSLFVITSAFVACSTNPITGRKQLHLVNEQELQSMATQEYRQFLSENRAISPSADRDAEMVRRVGQRVANAITSYLNGQGKGDLLAGYNWEFNLINN